MDNQRSGECDPLVAQQVEQLAATLLDWFQSGRYLIALSGGVDSAVVACAAQRSGCEAIAVTADSPSVAGREKEDAARVADLIGIKHHVLQTDEIADSRYRANDGQRCFHCKSHLFETIRQHFQTGTILTGTNADDLGDYRPGLRAAEAFDVQAPLAELGFKKERVRQLAAYWNLPIAEKPASPCLASRIAYGVTVTEERLAMIDQAEILLRDLGLSELRVRLHDGELARIEVRQEAIAKLASEKTRNDIVAGLKQIGFRYVTLDLAGFQSGSLNQLIQIEVPS